MLRYWNSLPDAAKVILVIVVLLLIYLLYKEVDAWWDMKSKEENVDWDKVPITGNDGSGDAQQWDPTDLAKDLYKSMKGINIPSPLGDARQEPLSRLANLQTDDQVKATHNAFLDVSGGGDLYEWVASQWVSASLIPTWSKAKARMEAAGLGTEA